MMAPSIRSTHVQGAPSRAASGGYDDKQQMQDSRSTCSGQASSEQQQAGSALSDVIPQLQMHPSHENNLQLELEAHILCLHFLYRV